MLKKDEKSPSIIEYLRSTNNLDLEQLRFIISIKTKEAPYIKSEVLCYLIKFDQFHLINDLFKCINYDNSLIIKCILLHKHKITFTNEEFKKYIASANYSKVFINCINQKDAIYGDYPLLCASMMNNNPYFLELLYNFSNENSIPLDVNEKNKNGDFPLLNMMSIEKATLFLKYVQNNNNNNNSNVILKINEKNNKGDYPLLRAVRKNRLDVVKLLMEYANKNNIILKLNEVNNEGNYPLLYATNKKNINMIKLLIKYANQNNIVLKINVRNNKDNYPLKIAIKKNNSQILKLLLAYAMKNNISLSKEDVFPFLSYDKIEILKILMKYAKGKKIALNLNVKNNYDSYPLLCSVMDNNYCIVEFLINYANEKNIVLELNDKNEFGDYPLLQAVDRNNTEMFQFIIKICEGKKYHFKN